MAINLLVLLLVRQLSARPYELLALPGPAQKVSFLQIDLPPPGPREPPPEPSPPPLASEPPPPLLTTVAASPPVLSPTPLPEVSEVASLVSPLALDLPRMALSGLPVLPPPGARMDPIPTLRIPPQYPPQARRAGVQGKVIVEFPIDANGKPGAVQILHAEPAGVFDQAVLQAVRAWRFDPAQLSSAGQRMRQDFVFHLRD